MPEKRTPCIVPGCRSSSWRETAVQRVRHAAGPAPTVGTQRASYDCAPGDVSKGPGARQRIGAGRNGVLFWPVLSGEPPAQGGGRPLPQGFPTAAGAGRKRPGAPGGTQLASGSDEPEHRRRRPFYERFHLHPAVQDRGKGGETGLRQPSQAGALPFCPAAAAEQAPGGRSYAGYYAPLRLAAAGLLAGRTHPDRHHPV